MKQGIKDIIQEFKKVQWPNWDTLQSDSIVVAVASVIIALIIYVMDQSFNSILGWFYSIF
jgi:preprotein translocase subunit SecE